MKKLYVTELTFAGKDLVEDSKILAQHGHTGWTADDIYELLVDMDDEINYFGKTGSVVSAVIVDNKSLAKWLVGSKLAAYNKATTVIDDDPDVYYNGEHYKFVCLIREVLSDFITSQIENALANPDFEMPSGIEVY